MTKRKKIPDRSKSDSAIVVFNNDCSANIILFEEDPNVLINATIHNRRYTGTVHLEELK